MSRLILLNILMFFIEHALTSPLEASPLENEAERIEINDAGSPSGSPSGSPISIDFFFDKSGNPQGGIILTYDQPRSHLARNLAHVLSQYGWSVAMINLKNETALPARTRPVLSARVPDPAADEDGTTNAINPTGEESLLANAEGSLSSSSVSQVDQLAGVIEFMEAEKGQFNLVFLSISNSWDYAFQYIIENTKRLANVRGLVMLNVNQATEIQKLPESIPIFDINTGRTASTAFQARKMDSQRHRIKKYRQLHLPTRHWQYDIREDRLTKRIRGWLSLNVEGMEILKENPGY